LVSIHAPAWGATKTRSFYYSFLNCFNPRARVGRDSGHDWVKFVELLVSIHAPAWGAT